MLHLQRKNVYLSILLLLSLSTFIFGQLTKDWYKVALNIPSSNNYSVNNSAYMAWTESYQQNAFMDLFEASKDTMWLNEIVMRIDTMMTTMWDAPPDSVLCNRAVYEDGYLGWGTTYYDPNNFYQEYMVHDAMIIVPILRFIEFVYDDEDLYSVYGKKANAYLEIIEKNIIAKWKVNWEGDAALSGETLEEWGGWRHLPNNQYLAFGKALIILHNISENYHYSTADTSYATFYIEKATEMGKTFKSNLYYKTTKDSYIWGYWTTYPPADDLSHGALAVWYAQEAYHKGIEFDLTDMQRFTNTFTELIWRNKSFTNPLISKLISGSSSENSGYYSWIWTSLAEFDFRVWEIVNAYIEYNFNNPIVMRKELISQVCLVQQLFDTYAPGTPTDVVLNIDGETANLEWTAPDQDEDSTNLTGLAGYNIYRSETSGGPYTQVNDTIITSHIYSVIDTSYHYAVTAVDYRKPANESPLAEVSAITGVEEDSNLPSEYFLDQNFPNPFNLTTEIKYSILETGHVVLRVYNIIGQEVAELVNKKQSSGNYKLVFNASKLTSGVYICHIQVNGFSESKKMILLK